MVRGLCWVTWFSRKPVNKGGNLFFMNSSVCLYINLSSILDIVKEHWQTCNFLYQDDLTFGRLGRFQQLLTYLKILYLGRIYQWWQQVNLDLYLNSILLFLLLCLYFGFIAISFKCVLTFFFFVASLKIKPLN